MSQLLFLNHLAFDNGKNRYVNDVKATDINCGAVIWTRKIAVTDKGMTPLMIRSIVSSCQRLYFRAGSRTSTVLVFELY